MKHYYHKYVKSVLKLNSFFYLISFLDDSLAPVAKLIDALNRVRSDENNRISVPSICGKAFLSIRNGKYSTALELLLNIDQEDGKSYLCHS